MLGQRRSATVLVLLQLSPPGPWTLVSDVPGKVQQQVWHQVGGLAKTALSQFYHRACDWSASTLGQTSSRKAKGVLFCPLRRPVFPGGDAVRHLGQAVADMESYRHMKMRDCLDFSPIVLYGWSFSWPRPSLFFSLLAGLLFLIVGPGTFRYITSQTAASVSLNDLPKQSFFFHFVSMIPA